MLHIEDKYEEAEEEATKTRTILSKILLLKCIITIPFYTVGIYKPEYIPEYPWILFIEAFHHYHARIFYLLAIHRSFAQFFVSLWGNGITQRRMIIWECSFDTGLVILFIHEYFGRKNFEIFLSPFFLVHSFLALISIICLFQVRRIKTTHVV